jgi:flagellin-like hook-associated protein FlgL
MAAEMSKLTGSQILLSASQSMQAQANQLPQNVLQLLQN